MAAKTWEADFRHSAIRESIAAFNEHGDELFDFPGSLCVPVAEKPIVGWTPGRVFAISFVLGFALLVSAVFVLRKAERDAKLGNGSNLVMDAIGASLLAAGMALFSVPVMLDRYIMKLVIGARGAELARRHGDLLCAEISNADRSQMELSIDGDDYVLLLADHANHRLLMEGVAARYIIRAEDVTDLKPFEFFNFVGVEITVRINGRVSLTIAIARVSWLLELSRQLPVLFFLRTLIKNRILIVCKKALEATHPHAGSLDRESRNG